MKRSEAILRIAESLIEPRHPDDPMREASCILGRLEKAGMLPPSYLGVFATAKRFIRGRDEGRDLYDFRGVWEPEDET